MLSVANRFHGSHESVQVLGSLGSLIDSGSYSACVICSSDHFYCTYYIWASLSNLDFQHHTFTFLDETLFIANDVNQKTLGSVGRSFSLSLSANVTDVGPLLISRAVSLKYLTTTKPLYLSETKTGSTGSGGKTGYDLLRKIHVNVSNDRK